MLCEGKRIEQFDGLRLPAKDIVSAYENNRWYADDYVINHAFYDPTITNDVTRMAAFGERIASFALGWGIHLLIPGTLSWSTSSNFTAASFSKGTVEGEISRVTGGRVSEIRFWSPTIPRCRFVLRYEYGDPHLPKYAPSRIQQCVVDGNDPRVKPYGEVTILQLETNAACLPIEAFDPHAFMASNTFGTFDVRYTNKTAYQFVGNRWSPISRMSKWVDSQSRIYFAAVLTLSLLAAYATIRARKSH